MLQFRCPLIAVRDLERSKQFYKDVLGLDVVADFGANVTLSGGLTMQSLSSWQGLIQRAVSFGSGDGELYFESDDVAAFAKNIAGRSDIAMVHPLREQAWGERVIRFYDPDRHIVEVGEGLDCVVHRFMREGLSPEETAVRMGVSLDLVKGLLS